MKQFIEDLKILNQELTTKEKIKYGILSTVGILGTYGLIFLMLAL